MAPRHQTEISADVAGSPEAFGIINCRCECESRELPDTGNAHQPAARIGRSDHPSYVAVDRHVAASTAVRAATRPCMAADRPGIPSLAWRACLMNVELSARGSRTPNTTARPRIWFSRLTRCPASFLRAMISERTACAGRDFT